MRILICDDDQSLMQVIVSHVNWKELGIDHVLTAENGVKAKELIRQFKPEVILCDIGMPMVNGIEVLKYIRETGLESEFAFLTCYEDFEYAREAVRYGARRYLTKPVVFEELIPALKEMTAAAAAKQERVQTSEALRTEDHLVLNTILRAIRDGMYEEDPERINERLKIHRSTLMADTMIRLIPYRVDLGNAVGQNPEDPLWREIVQTSAKMILHSETMETAVVDVDGNTLKALLFLTEEVDSARLKENCEGFVARMKEVYGIAPVMLISPRIPLATTWSVNRKMIEQLHHLRFQEGRVFEYGAENRNENNPAPVRSAVNEEKILGYLRTRDQAGYLRYMAGSVNQITRQGQNSDIQMTLLHHSLLRLFYTCAETNHIDRHDIFGSEAIRMADGNCESSSYEMIRYAGMLFARMMELLEKEGSSDDAISLAKHYIEKHYAENLDRDMIAKAAHITPNYLSKLFHQETGMSLREYVNQLRIREAKRMMLSTESSIGEIASNVGFDNISYFSTVFRKMTGLSPVEWREHPE